MRVSERVGACLRVCQFQITHLDNTITGGLDVLLEDLILGGGVLDHALILERQYGLHGEVRAQRVDTVAEQQAEVVHLAGVSRL